MTAFEPAVLADDFSQVSRILADFVAARSLQDWSRKTEERPQGWTLHQTLAHLTATAQAIYQAIDDTLDSRTVSFPGITRRAELAAYNARAIAAREQTAPPTLAEELLAVLDHCAERCSSLKKHELALPFSAPFYNRPLSVAEALGWELMHPGVVHAAQLANGASLKPLWTHYAPDLLRRQITRFFHIMSHSYWPERGGDLRASIHFVVAGQSGGRWHLVLDPNGGRAGEGTMPRPTLIVWMRSADVLCRLMTFQINPAGALARGQMLAWGNIGLGFRLPYLLTPT